ncbi:MAG TPA: TetR/AcrR family transcriptional regulator [Myxococcales bacterium]|nr:TetR/AcrR family transcriptional regulator [Myxococcales bacterium]
MTKGTETRDRILETAFRLAAREGLEGLSIGQLAEEMKISKSGLFAHFKSKEELQINTLRVAAERFTQGVLVPAFKEPRGLPRIRALVDRWLRWYTDRALPGGCLFVAAVFEMDDRPGMVREVLVELQRQLMAALGKSARIAMDEGHFRRDLDPAQFAFEFNSILLGFNHSWRLMDDPKAERRARAAFARLIESSQARS